MICTISKHAAEKEGFNDALMLDWRGYVAETTGANVFLIRDGVVHTPLTDCFLDGITRRSVIELIKKMGLEVVERHIPAEELGTFTEMFVTGTAAEVHPGVAGVRAPLHAGQHHLRPDGRLQPHGPPPAGSGLIQYPVIPAFRRDDRDQSLFPGVTRRADRVGHLRAAAAHGQGRAGGGVDGGLVLDLGVQLGAQQHDDGAHPHPQHGAHRRSERAVGSGRSGRSATRRTRRRRTPPATAPRPRAPPASPSASGRAGGSGRKR